MIKQLLPASNNVSVAIPLFPSVPSLEPKPVDWQVVERVAQFERTAFLRCLIAETLQNA